MNVLKTMTILTALGVSAAASAQEPPSAHGSMMGQGSMHQRTDAGARGEGVVNAVDTVKEVVNITHGPIEALRWPGMTMDMPVAKGVDLADLQAGERVRFTLVLGGDNVYRITALEPAR